MNADGPGQEKTHQERFMEPSSSVGPEPRSPLDSATPPGGLWPHVGWLVILSAVAVMPLGEAGFNITIAVLAVLGVVTLIRTPAIIRDWRVGLFIALWLCFWVPMVISLVGAVEPERAARTVAAYIRFVPGAIFVIAVLRNPTARRWLPIGVLIVVAVWCVDGMIQWWFGRNTLGFPYDGRNLTGLFHPKRVIGLLVAGLFPVVLETCWRLSWSKNPGIEGSRDHEENAGSGERTSRSSSLVARSSLLFLISLPWLLVALMPIVVLLGGSRTSWMMLIVGIFCWIVYRYVRSAWRYKTAAVLAAILAMAFATPFILQLPGMEERVDQTRQLFRGDYEGIDRATTGRLPIWEIAVAMWRDHPITGVGPRGFRYMYPDYGDEDTPLISPDGETGGYHPHQTTLEVMVETGLVGLIGFALFWVLLAIGMFRHGGNDAWPWAFAVVVAYFPLNAHMAIYGTYWSHIAWWLVMVTVGMLGSRPNGKAGPA